MTNPAYKMCVRCVMDTSDPEISFDARGECNHCQKFDLEFRGRFGPAPEAVSAIAETIKAAGAGKPYDCVLGVSGGVDSSYLAFLTRSLGLRPLAVHVDNGWNSELAVGNIERLLKRVGIDLFTEVLDWEEFRDLQLSFLKATTPDGEVPTDHAIVAVVYRVARQHGIRYIISGSNLATESCMPRRWAYGHIDWRYIRSVHRRFGTQPLKTFPHYSMLQPTLRALLGTHQVVRLLNLIDYDKAKAKQTLIDDFGWRDYGGKHYESVYTRFYQGSILPKQFNIDKRRAHQTSLIWCGQATRAEALAELNVAPLDPELERQDEVFVAKKLGLSLNAFRALITAAPKSYRDYPHSHLIAGDGAAYRALRAGVRLAFSKTGRKSAPSF